jgi:hypothetical protein
MQHYVLNIGSYNNEGKENRLYLTLSLFKVMKKLEYRI